MVSKGKREDVRKQYRRLRLDANKTQWEVELETGLPAGRYWKIENGIHDPDADERKKLARVLRVSADQLPTLTSIAQSEVA